MASKSNNTQGLFHCLVVDDDQQIRDFIGFLLESQHQAEVEYAASGNQACEIIRARAREIDLVVCDYRMADGNGGDVFKFLVENKISIPFILCSSESPGDHPEFQLGRIAGFAEKPMFYESLSAAVVEFLKSRSAAVPVEHKESEFIRVQIRLLRLVNVLPCDIYIQLGDRRYVQVYNRQDVFADLDSFKYQAKNIDYLFIAKEDCGVFFDKLIKDVMNMIALKAVTDEKCSDPLFVSRSIEETIHDIGSRLGFTPELKLLVKANLQVTLKLISRNPELSALLSQIGSKSGNYISSHSVDLAVVGCWMAMKVGWYSEQTFLKLTLAAFLHDITIADQELAKVCDEKELGAPGGKFTAEQIAIWKSHPIKAAEIAAQFEEVPPDADIIIAQHHERPHGEGAPHRLNHSRIAPLSALFIVAHDLVEYLTANGAQSDIGVFRAQVKDLYDIGYFKKIIQAL